MRTPALIQSYVTYTSSLQDKREEISNDDDNIVRSSDLEQNSLRILQLYSRIKKTQTEIKLTQLYKETQEKQKSKEYSETQKTRKHIIKGIKNDTRILSDCDV